ncbi:MAG: hypothetical protein INR70_15720 [Parafilimonas terrae]|nr:hypothetical protein [Parafilimonas terrae]
MSGGYGPPIVNTFGMIAGLGKTFDDAYDAGVKARQEREAPEILSKLLAAQSGAATAPSTGTLGTIAQSYQNGGAKPPSFASSGGAAGDYLRTVSGIESGGDDAAKNPNSTATGRYQFTQDTWNGLARERPDLGLTPNGRTDPDQQERAMQAFTAKNADILSKAGIPLTPGHLYLSHFLGPAGGPRFITGAVSNPDAPATDFVTPGAAAANRTVFYNRDGSPKSAAEVYAERTGRFPGGSAPTPTLPTQVAGGGSTPTMTMPALSASGRSSVVAQADPDAANKPTPGAQPAGFFVPGQSAPVPAPSTAPQGFAGFGSASTRMSPDQQEALAAAWKNPITRPMATAIYGEILKGKQSQWQLTTMGNQPVLFNQSTAQIVPVGQSKPNTATVGDTLIDLDTRQPIYQAPEKLQMYKGSDGNDYSFNPKTGERQLVIEGKDDKYTYQTLPGVGMVALHPTDPNKSRVIIEGQRPRPMTPEEAAQFSKGYYGADGTPHIPSAGVQILPGEKEKDKKIGEAIGSEIADAINAGRPAQEKLNAIGIMRDALDTGADKITTGPLAENVLRLKQFAKGSLGMDVEGLSNSEVIQKIGTQLATANAKSLTSRPTQFDFATYLKNNPGLLLSPEGNHAMLDLLQQQAQREYDLSRLATKTENQNDFGAVVDAYDKAHPIISPFTKQPIRTGDVNAPAPGGAPRPTAGAAGADSLGEAGGPGTMPPAPSDQPAPATVPTPGGGTRLAIPPRVANTLRNQPDTAENRAAFDAQYGAGAAQNVLRRPLPTMEEGDTSLPKGKDRIPIPGGLSAAAAIAEARKQVAAGRDKASVAARLRSWGISPKRLDE